MTERPPDIVDLYRSGVSLREIATRFRRGQKAVRDHLLQAGIQIREPGGTFKHDPRRARAATLYAQGLSLRATAAAVQCSVTTLRGWLRDAGVDTRPAGRPCHAKQADR